MAKFLFVYRSDKDAFDTMRPDQLQLFHEKWRTWIAEGKQKGWMLDAAEGDIDWMSRRSVQRHFRRVTGMTLSSYQQIQRARLASTLLTGGSSVLSATYEAGYFDQAHLTRSVKQLIGMTPARLARERPQLSFSYKTTAG